MTSFACNSQIPQANCCQGPNSNKYKFICFHGYKLKHPCYFFCRVTCPLLFLLQKVSNSFCYRLQKPKKSAQLKCIANGAPVSQKGSKNFWCCCKMKSVTFWINLHAESTNCPAERA